MLNVECDNQLLENIVDYVGMMLGKGPSLLESMKRTGIRFKGESVNKDTEYKLKHWQYMKSESGMLLHSYSEMTAFTRILIGKELFLLTGDHHTLSSISTVQVPWMGCRRNWKRQILMTF